jgi:hypothetical protein
MKEAAGTRRSNKREIFIFEVARVEVLKIR